MIEDIRYLVVFAKVAEAGSLTGGAEALGLTAATVSLHLTKLEKHLGKALLYRNTRKLSLTHDGAKLLETAQAMLDLYEKGIGDFKQSSNSPESVDISIPALFINSAFMESIGDFVDQHPDVRLNISCSDHRDDIIGDSIDVAFRIGELPDSGLKAKHLFALPRKVVAARSLLDRNRPIEHPRELEPIPWIGLTMRPDSRRFRHASGEEFEINYSPTIRVDNVEAAYRLARLGLGLAAPPVHLASKDLASGVMAAVLPDWSLDPLKVYAVWPANIAADSIALTLVESIYESFSSRQLI